MHDKKLSRPAVLCILDGFAFGDKENKHNAVSIAKKPNLDDIQNRYPSSSLVASGKQIGLPDKQYGSSEVGHSIIGSGRILEQNITMISNGLNDIELIEGITNLAKHHIVHIIGLFSNGGVHSHIDHIMSIANYLCNKNKRIIMHVISDGRDAGIYDAKAEISTLLKHNKIELGTICGRYYAMDRDNKLERTSLAYNLYNLGDGLKTDDPLTTVQNMYDHSISDEFIPPISSQHFHGIADNEAILFVNFRADRMRQIVSQFMNNVQYKGRLFTMTEYFEEDNITEACAKPTILFHKPKVQNTLASTLSSHGLRQLHIAETEKYAHVTFFFNGGNEIRHKHEDWVIIPSPNVSSYDKTPEMSSIKICDYILQNMHNYDVIILNLANCDIVGHTGNFEATVKAVECVDDIIGKISNAVIQNNGVMIITADHGNADNMMLDNALPHTQHTTADVPFIVIKSDLSKHDSKIRNGNIADVATTMLYLMGIEIPDNMTGTILLEQ